MRKAVSAALFVDCRCTLGEGILWWQQRRALLWTDIERSVLWMHGVDGHHTSMWTLPDRLGSLAICESGRLVLGLAKGLFYGDFTRARDNVLHVEEIVAVDSHLSRHRINDGRTDRSGNFVFGTMNEAQDAATGSFYQFSAAHGLRRLDLGGVIIPNSICFSLNCAIEKMIKQHFIFRKMFPDIQNVIFKFLLVDHDLHALSAQNIGRSYKQRKTYCF